MDKESRRTWGILSSIAGVIFIWKPIKAAKMLAGRRMQNIFRFSFRHFPVRFTLGILLVLAGIVLLLLSIEKKKAKGEYWRISNDRRVPGVVKRIQKETNLGTIARILGLLGCNKAEVRKAAEKRRIELLNESLETGEITDEVKQAISSIISQGFDSPENQEFLVGAAKKRPEIIQSLWPDMQKKVHEDRSSHTDVKPGTHCDRTTYYDFYRYPDGRTVPNKSGRRSHTDTRVTSGDCHDDRHQDSNAHTDNPHNEKLARFKPYISE